MICFSILAGCSCCSLLPEWLIAFVAKVYSYGDPPGVRASRARACFGAGLRYDLYAMA
jgi:hypothetical protein